jgi:hypothetical protein
VDPVPYKDLYFGKSDSKKEASTQPDDFLRSYVDLDNSVSKVISGEKTLVLGPKGTGKSALAWYLQQTSGRGAYISRVRDAQTLPLSEIPNLKTGQEAGIQRTVTAWKLILLANYLDVVLLDTSVRFPELQEAKRVWRILRDFGLMGADSGRKLLSIAGPGIQVQIDTRAPHYRSESGSSLNIYSLIPHMTRWAQTATSANRHILTLDGLDSIYLNDEKYDESMTALLQAWFGINQDLRSSRGSVVLLIRNDVFSRIALSLPDSQKMRDDEGIQLDWRVFTGGMEEQSPLFRLVNRKAGLELGRGEIDVLSYFPQNIVVSHSKGASRHGRGDHTLSRLQYLLNLTRHTPRDVLRLFEEIRQTAESGSFDIPDPMALPQEVIREGAMRYCNNYFVGAIQNEFAGDEGGPQAASGALDALQFVGKHHFTRSEFRSRLDGAHPELVEQSDRLLRLLFMAGAIGNLVPGSAKNYAQFYHRKDNAQIYLQGSFILHNALVRAWGIPFESGR